MQPIYQIKISSPLGTLVVESKNDQIVRILLETNLTPSVESISPKTGSSIPDSLIKAKKQLEEYFRGTRKTFDLSFTISLPIKYREMLEYLSMVPYGKTVTYGELAIRTGTMNGARKAGHAMAMNPLPILIPCHRVICAGKSIGGYSLGGTHNKELLLTLEGAFPLKEA